MKKVKRKSKKQWITLVSLLTSFAVLLASYFIVDAFMGKGQTENPTEKPEILDGEALYLNTPVAYPRVEEGKIQYIIVRNESGTFDFTRPSEDGSFWLSYDNGEGISNSVVYEPPILSAEGGFDYESLYALEYGDGYGKIYLLTYLCTAIGTPYFEERIVLPTADDEESQKERALTLEECGLDKKTQRVSFVYTYKDKDGNTQSDTHDVIIGNRSVSGSGFYFMVDGRDYIYYTSNNYFEYALRGFYSFIKGTLVAPGLSQDSTYEPYLTTDFKEWVTDVHEQEGESVIAGSNVVATGNAVTPIYKGADYTPAAGEDGYSRKEGTSLGFDMSSLTDIPDYKRLEKFLTSLKVWEDYSSSPKKITLTDPYSDSASGLIEFDESKSNVYKIKITSIDGFILGGAEITAEGESVGSASAVIISGTYTLGEVTESFNRQTLYFTEPTVSGTVKAKIRAGKVGQLEESVELEITHTESVYTYTVTAVEAVLLEGGDCDTPGYSLSGATAVRLEYTLSIDGKSQGTLKRHGVFYLDDGVIPAAAANEIRGLSVGTLDTPLVFDITYTERNCHAMREEIVIGEICAVYNSEGEPTGTVAADSYVTFTYYQTVNGVKGSMTTLSIGMKEASESAKWSVITSMLIGKKRGESINKTAFSDLRYFEVARSFITFEIDRVDFFITSEMVSSFRFANPSERDPFYGESFYENTLGNEYKLYGLNASACEGVVRFLGGIADDSTSSVGLVGETVKVGLTHADLKKFKYKIYFELPRGIYDKSEAEGDDGQNEDFSDNILGNLSDYAWYGTLGFTLYISEEQPDGTRLVGSDMYDLIAKVDGENFYFLEYEFVDFWARRYMVLMDMREIDRIEVDFNMEDIYGEFNFDLDKTYAYLINGENGKEVVTTKPEGDDPYTVLTIDRIFASTTKESMDTALKDYLEELKLFDKEDPRFTRVEISNLYNHTLNNDLPLPLVGTVDTVGVTNFKHLYELLETVRYQDPVTDAEREHALTLDPIMTLKIRIRGQDNFYTYEFRRFSDRKVMVSVKMTDASGNVVDGLAASDFYITTYSFKKIVKGFFGVVNGSEIDVEDGYMD